jgi:hypothetical protein
MPNKYKFPIPNLKTFVICSLVLIGTYWYLFEIRPVIAQTRLPLIVAPARQSVNIDPGGTQDISVSFLNQAEVAIAGNIRVVNFIVSNDSGLPILLEDENSLPTKYAAADWVTLPANKGVIRPNDILKVQARIKAPADAIPGGHYIAIYFEPTGSLPNPNLINNQKEGTQAVTSRITALVYIRVNGPINESALLKTFAAKKFIEFGPAEANVEILNRGSYHITPKGQITLQNWFGKTVDTFTLDEKNIFPDTSRSYTASLGSRLMLGRYEITLTAVYGESNKVINQTIYFWAFPVRIAIIVILSIVIIILLVRLVWTNLKKRQNKLEETLKQELSEVEELKEKYKDKIS